MLEEKLVLVDDDGKPLKKVDDPGNTDNDSEVEEAFNKNTCFMTSTSSKPYDDDDFYDYGLTEDQLKFANAFDNSLRGQLRRMLVS
ncbi:hypothetical protein Tco_0886752 [Tanacetum coccineum]